MNHYYRSREALEQGKRLKEIILKSERVQYKDIERKAIAALGFPEIITKKADDWFGTPTEKIKKHEYQLAIEINPLEMEIEKHFISVNPVNPKKINENDVLLYSEEKILVVVYETEKQAGKQNNKSKITEVYEAKNEVSGYDVFRRVPKNQEVMPLNQTQLEEILMRIKVIKRS